MSELKIVGFTSLFIFIYFLILDLELGYSMTSYIIVKDSQQYEHEHKDRYSKSSVCNV